jgi:hypothetical protein
MLMGSQPSLHEYVDIYLQKVNIFNITKHDETEFSDVVVSSIIRGWAQGEKTEHLAGKL